METCTHLDQVEILDLPAEIAGCEECLKTGDRWVHLRMCHTCGKIGCCDSFAEPARQQARARGRGTRSSAPRSRARTGRGAPSTT